MAAVITPPVTRAMPVRNLVRVTKAGVVGVVVDGLRLVRDGALVLAPLRAPVAAVPLALCQPDLLPDRTADPQLARGFNPTERGRFNDARRGMDVPL